MVYPLCNVVVCVSGMPVEEKIRMERIIEGLGGK